MVPGRIRLSVADARALGEDALRGIGYNALVLSFSAAAGPTLAALILSVGSWPWLFLINLPIGVAAIAVGLKALPSTKGHGARFDAFSAALSAAMAVVSRRSVVSRHAPQSSHNQPPSTPTSGRRTTPPRANRVPRRRARMRSRTRWSRRPPPAQPNGRRSESEPPAPAAGCSTFLA